MDIGKLLSLKDYFNYYIGGCVWILDLIAMIILLPNKPNFNGIGSNPIFSNQISSAIIIGLAGLILPYTVGFSLSESGKLVTSVYYKIKGDPSIISLDYDFPSKSRKINKVSLTTLEQAAKLLQDLFHIDEEDFKSKPSRYLYLIRTYVAYKGGNVNDLTSRALDLSTLAESLIIPFPLLLGFLSYFVSPFILISFLRGNISTPQFMIARIILASVVFGLSFLLILERHLKLREYWAKHVIRSFVVLSTQEMWERSKENQNPKQSSK